MENETITEDSHDLLSQSYSDGIKRITGYKDVLFEVPRRVKKVRQIYWIDFFDKYSTEVSYESDLHIKTFKSFKRKPLSVIQYWVDTGYLPYNTLMDKVDQSECSEESLNERSEGQDFDENSSSTTFDTAIYISKNKNKTNKKETMAIVEGAKHNTVTNHQNANCENAGTVQFITGEISDSNSKNITLDSNDNNCRPLRRSSKTLEHVTQENNTEKSVNRDDIHDSKWSSTRHSEQVSMITENSMFLDNTTKLSRRKKLYSGRDSPVDLVHTTSNNRSTIFEQQSNLHPALDASSKITKGYKIYKNRRMTQFSMLHRNMNSMFTFSSPRARKRRKTNRNYFNSSFSILPASKKRRSLFPLSIVNNLIKKQSSVRRLSTGISENTKSKEEIEPNNSIGQTEKLSDEEEYEIFNRREKELNDFGSIVYLRQLSESSTRTSAKLSVKSSKTVMRYRGLNPVVRLKRLSESDIQKYKKPNKTEANRRRLDPLVCLKQLSEPDIHKYTKSNKIETCRRHLNPVVRLKLLSESDIQKYKKIDKTISTRLYNISSAVQSRTDKIARSENSEIQIVNVSDDTESDMSTVIMIGCHNSERCSGSNCSASTITKVLPFRTEHNDCILKHETSFNKENRELDNSILRKRSEAAENKLRRGNRMNLSTNSFRKQREKNTCVTENAKNLKDVGDDESIISRRSIRNKNLKNQNQDADVSERRYKTGYSNSIRASKYRKAKFRKNYFLISDEDDEFVNLIKDVKDDSNSKSSKKVLYQTSNNLVDREDKVRNNNRPNGAGKPNINHILHQFVTTSINSRKQGSYLNGLRNSSIQSKLSQEENINHANHVNARNLNSSLQNRASRKLIKSQSILQDRKQVLTNANTKKINPRILYFRTKIFDSDSESSSYL